MGRNDIDEVYRAGEIQARRVKDEKFEAWYNAHSSKKVDTKTAMREAYFAGAEGK
jgi:hypothetical protein